jgi:hypothetical protein
VQKDKLQHINLIEEFLFQEIEMYFSISSRANQFWFELKRTTDSYVFGGFIVDYLNHNNKHRDIDIVVASLDNNLLKLIKSFNGIKNSFGGYKIIIDQIIVDVWAIKDTWAIKKMNSLNFDLINLLPSTSFFNSTAIIFSITTKKLTFHKKFLEYINNDKLDILFEDNPYPALCILKSYQYFKLGINFTNKLSKYIYNRFKIYYNQLEDMQLKHYGYLRYSQNELINFANEIDQNLKSEKRTKYNLINSDQLFLFDTQKINANTL